MKTYLLLLLFCVLGSSAVTAQSYGYNIERRLIAGPKPPSSSITALGGATLYQGDLVQPFLDLAVGQFAYGIRYTKYVNYRASANMDFLLGKIMGDDAMYVENAKRGYKLSPTTLMNASFNIDYFIRGTNYYRWKQNGGIYINAGIGIAMTEASPIGVKYNPEDTHGVAVSAQLGGGYKYHFNKYFTIGVEVSYRPTFTDKLDGIIITEGYSQDIDAFTWVGLAATYQISSKRKVNYYKKYFQ